MDSSPDLAWAFDGSNFRASSYARYAPAACGQFSLVRAVWVVRTHISLAVHCSCFSREALWPVRLDLNDFICISERIVEVFQRGIRSRAVGVEDMILRVKFNCLGKLFTVTESDTSHTHI
jgi:hypothetical protein